MLTCPGSGRLLQQVLATPVVEGLQECDQGVDALVVQRFLQQLKQLEKDRIVQRTVYPEIFPRIEYTLSDMGVALGPTSKALIEWAEMRRRVLDEV